MTTRYKAGSELGVPSGYSGFTTDDGYFLPSCTIEDVDKALFNTFKDEIQFLIESKEGVKKVPIIFATGERFALVKRREPFRTKDGTLILPLISIARTKIAQNDQDISSRGINQHTGDLIIKKRLSEKDRTYQKLLNKLDLRNQVDIAISQDVTGSKRLRTDRYTSENKLDIDIIDNAFLASKQANNIFEFITIPQPQFYTATYDIVFYAQYTQHLNDMLQKLVLSYLPQGRKLRLNTEKGYWFIALFEDQISPENNLDDFSEKERIIKASIGCNVRAYLIPGSLPGEENPVKRYVSAPGISFKTYYKVRDITKNPYKHDGDPSSQFLLTDTISEPEKNPPSEKRNEKTHYNETIKNPFTQKDDLRHVILDDEDIGENVFRQT